MIKTIQTEETKTYCDICGESAYSRNNGEPYDFCHAHKDLYEITQKIASMNFTNVQDMLHIIIEEAKADRSGEIIKTLVKEAKHESRIANSGTK